MNSSQSTAAAKPTHEQVALRAELLWKAKGSPSGQDEQIWLEAERQLFEEAKELMDNTASSTPASGSGSGSPSASSRSEESSVAAEKMTSKSGGSKSSSRRK